MPVTVTGLKRHIGDSYDICDVPIVQFHVEVILLGYVEVGAEFAEQFIG
jgi:hypothetical protein